MMEGVVSLGDGEEGFLARKLECDRSFDALVRLKGEGGSIQHRHWREAFIFLFIVLVEQRLHSKVPVSNLLYAGLRGPIAMNNEIVYQMVEGTSKQIRASPFPPQKLPRDNFSNLVCLFVKFLNFIFVLLYLVPVDR